MTKVSRLHVLDVLKLFLTVRQTFLLLFKSFPVDAIEEKKGILLFKLLSKYLIIVDNFFH